MCDEHHCAILPQRSQVLHFPLITISQQTVHSGSFLLILHYFYWMQRRHQRVKSLRRLLLDVAHVRSTDTFTRVFTNSPEPVQCVQTSVQGGLLWLQPSGYGQETAWKGWQRSMTPPILFHLHVWSLRSLEVLLWAHTASQWREKLLPVSNQTKLAPVCKKKKPKRLVVMFRSSAVY